MFLGLINDCFFDPTVESVSLDTLVLILVQGTMVIGLGKIIHLALRRYNQPRAISQILAGVIVGSLGLHDLIVHVDVGNVEDMYNRYVSETRIYYMFYLGLEADLAALWNDQRRCTIVTYASVAACLFLAACVSGGMYASMMHTPVKSPALLASILMLTLADTSSVDVSRMAGELNLAATDSGQLVVAVAVATNFICIIGEGVFSCTKMSSARVIGYSPAQRLGLGVLALLTVGAALALLRPLVSFMNRRNAGRHRVSNWELVLLFIGLEFVGHFPEVAGFDGMPASLLLGLAFPREGPVARSILDTLGYPLHALALPFYFGAMGMRLNFSAMSGAIVVPAIMLTLLGLFGKCVGTMSAARYLKMPLADAVRFGVLLNIKGHINMINMEVASTEGVWAEQALMAMVVGSMISSIIAGPVFAAVYRKERTAYLCSNRSLECLGPDQELRMLACVHGARGAPAMLSLVELTASNPQVQPTIHLLHLFEIKRKPAGRSHYHKRVRIESDRHADRRNDAATQVNWAVDVFTSSTGLVIRQVDAGDRGTAVSAKAIHRCTDEIRADLLLLPYRKEQRFDGRMICRREDHADLTLEVLERAPCTTGILADRPFRRGGTTFQLPTKISTGEEVTAGCGQSAPTQVAAVFLGGPDDREAVALACRLAKSSSVFLTVIRFVLHRDDSHLAEAALTPTPRADRHDGEVLVVVHDGDGGNTSAGRVRDSPDESFMAAFHRDYVAKELAAYQEKAVRGPTDLVEALRGMSGAHALVVAGRGGRQPTELVAGLEGWAECAQVGPVGEILASHECLHMGSVLVTQQKTVLPPFQLDLQAAL